MSEEIRIGGTSIAAVSSPLVEAVLAALPEGTHHAHLTKLGFASSIVDRLSGGALPPHRDQNRIDLSGCGTCDGDRRWIGAIEDLHRRAKHECDGCRHACDLLPPWAASPELTSSTSTVAASPTWF